MSPPSSKSPIPKLTPVSVTPQIRSFVSGQVFGTIPPIPAPINLKNLTVVITGANSGLGLEAAKQLVQLGCVGRLILACRSLKKGEDAKKIVLGAATANGGSGEGKKNTQDHKSVKDVSIEVWELDMASLKSVRDFAERCNRHLDRIDTLVLNAGVDLVNYRRTGDEDGGYEMTIMVNVVGTFVLAVLMVDVMRAKTSRNGSEDALVPPRISIVGSAVQFFARYEPLLQAAQSGEGILRWLSDEKRWNGKITEERYFLSKGMVQMLVRQLAGKINEGGRNGKKSIVVNCTSPGYCRTNLFTESTSVGRRMILRVVGRDAHVGARALVGGAVGENGGPSSHGGYIDEGVVKDCHSWFGTAQGEEVGRQLWMELLEVASKVKPGITETL